MKEKKPKSPLVVFSAMLFLAMFIILPPLFRAFFNDDVQSDGNNLEMYVLSCEKVSVSENYKINIKMNFENKVPIKNTIIYTKYTPTNDDALKYQGIETDLTVEEELSLFNSASNIEIVESGSKTYIVLNEKVVSSNPDNHIISNNMRQFDKAVIDYKDRGFICTTTVM